MAALKSSDGSPIRIVWDLTYACPLRCIHCYSESGRRPARTLKREAMAQVVEAIIAARPLRVSFGGGEPLLAPWWSEAARRIRDAGIPVAVFTSGWLMTPEIAAALAECASTVAVSIDGPSAAIHDRIRGRQGSFVRAMETLRLLDAEKARCQAQGRDCYVLDLEYTVTSSGRDGALRFVREMSSRYPSLDLITFGAAVPEGLAQEEGFAAELLDATELVMLQESEPVLAAAAANGVTVSVTDVSYFLPLSPLAAAGESILHIEPDGQCRAFTNYEAKVGNVLDEPLEALWERALAWRRRPDVAALRASIENLQDWARVTRLLDRRYGSPDDQARIARRGTELPPRAATPPPLGVDAVAPAPAVLAALTGHPGFNTALSEQRP